MRRMLTGMILTLLMSSALAEDAVPDTMRAPHYQLAIEQDGHSRVFEPSEFESADLASIGDPDSRITIEIRRFEMGMKLAYRIVHGNFADQANDVSTLMPGAGLIPSAWTDVEARFSIRAAELQDTPPTVIHQFSTIESNSGPTAFNINPAFVELRITHRQRGEQVIRLRIHHGC